MLSNHKISAFLAALIFLFILTTAATASNFLAVLNPETVKAPSIVPPLLAPPPASEYTVYHGDLQIKSPDGRPIAQFSTPPTNLAQSISINLPEVLAIGDSNTVSYSILASVKYEGNGQKLLLTTARPSPIAAQQPTAFGNQTIQLRNGTVAWATNDMPGSFQARSSFFARGLSLPLPVTCQLATSRNCQ